MSTAEERMQNAIEELEQENRLLRARNERLEAELMQMQGRELKLQFALGKGSYEAVFGHLDMTPDELGNYVIELQEKAALAAPTVQEPVLEVVNGQINRTWDAIPSGFTGMLYMQPPLNVPLKKPQEPWFGSARVDDYNRGWNDCVDSIDATPHLSHMPQPWGTYMGHRMTPSGTKEFWGVADATIPEGTKLYTTPPAAQRQWIGLTEEQKLSLEIQGGKSDVMLAELVEGWLKEKNT